MKKGIAFLVLLGLGGSGWAAPKTQFQTRRLSPTEKMMWSTYAVGTKKGMATCFVVARKSPGTKGGVVPVIVTSVHMLKTAPRGPFYFGARIPDASGKPQVAILEYRLDDKTAPIYVRHPEQDVAAIQLPANARLDVLLPSFLPEDSIGRSGDKPRAGDDISFLGFPEVFPSTDGAFPVLRGGKIASYSLPAAGQTRRFLVNASVYPGDSGGPVFTVGRGGRPVLVGMVTQRVAPEDHTVVPLAVAVDASVIRETLALLDRPSKATALPRPARTVGQNVARVFPH